MQEDNKNLIKMIRKILKKSDLISLKTKIDLESNMISVKFSVLCDENAISENSHKMDEGTQEIIEDKTFKEVLTSGLSKNEIEQLKELYEAYDNQNKSGISLSSENHDGIR